MKKNSLGSFQSKIFAVLLLVFLFILGFVPKATMAHGGSDFVPKAKKAHEGPNVVVDCGILVWITGFESKDPIYPTPDYYADVWINGIQQQRMGPAKNKKNPSLWWGFEEGFSCKELEKNLNHVRIRVQDANNARYDPYPVYSAQDTHMNISWSRKTRDLNLYFMAPGLTEPNAPFISALWEGSPPNWIPGFILPKERAFGENITWTSGRLSSWGSGTKQDVLINYEVVILREPDFRVNLISIDKGKTLVTVVNDGGPGILNRVSCYRPGSQASTIHIKKSEGRMGPGEVKTFKLSIDPLPGTVCSVSGMNWFLGPEPHTDNNSNIRK